MLEIPKDASIERRIQIRQRHLAELVEEWRKAIPAMWEDYFGSKYGAREEGYANAYRKPQAHSD